MIAFEEDPSRYGLGLFVLDVVILGLLFASFYFLWVKPADVGFFTTVALQVVGITTWNSCSGVRRFSLRDRYDQLMVACGAVCAAPAVTALVAAGIHTIAKYLWWAVMVCFLGYYTKNTLKD
jgi:hypothetical protein